MKKWTLAQSNLFIIIFIYVIIFIQYPLGVGITQLVLHKSVQTAMEPSYLLLWGLVRIGVVLPLIFFLMQRLSWDRGDIFLRLGDYKRVIAVTFWLSFIFMLIGYLLYPWFLRPSNLTALLFVEYSPIFLVYAVSNAFVEEAFFRGVLQNYLSKKASILLAIIIQAVFYAGIHLYSPMSSNLWPFVGLTLVLGLIWGWLTEKYKSLLPAVILHVVADVFVAVSLF